MDHARPIIFFDPESEDGNTEDDGWFLRDSKVIDLREIFEEMRATNNPNAGQLPSGLRLIEGLAEDSP